MSDRQEVALISAFRQMTPDAKNELLRFVISSAIHPPRPKPQLKVVGGKDNT